MSTSDRAAGQPKEKSSDERRPRGRPKVVADTQQRTAIVDVAALLFLERGYGKTTMGEIAAAAHVSLASIYRFFPGKTDLFAAVVANHRQTMLALPGDYADIPLETALGQIFRIDLDDEAGRKRDALMAMFLVESHQFPELVPILKAQGPEQSITLLQEWLDRQNSVGRVSINDTALAAAMIMDVVFGASSLKTSQTPQWPGGKDRRTYLKQCFALLADGLKPRLSIIADDSNIAFE
ncbi:hypothetical protein ACO34A_22705 (plasmid) [Rhizobium sp. ACO-34A]|nr:TetR/AcrR family transcriptional regulator [Rhizobium sp. ACO-34A]ATN36602.1 hypothetical protein ACO34A_22705 [Rhizobium sp. ACO-34A]